MYNYNFKGEFEKGTIYFCKVIVPLLSYEDEIVYSVDLKERALKKLESNLPRHKLKSVEITISIIKKLGKLQPPHAIY